MCLTLSAAMPHAFMTHVTPNSWGQLAGNSKGHGKTPHLFSFIIGFLGDDNFRTLFKRGSRTFNSFSRYKANGRAGMAPLPKGRFP